MLWNVFIVIRYIFPLHVKVNFAFNIIWQHYLKYVSMENGFGEVFFMCLVIVMWALLFPHCGSSASLAAPSGSAAPRHGGS